MIRTCTDSIENTNTEVTNALTGFEHTFDLTSDGNKLFSVDLDTSQSIYIKILIKNSSSTSAMVFINIIRKSDLETVRSIKIRNSTVITTDLSAGEYYICVRTLLGAFTLGLTVDYLRYSRNVTFDNIQMSYGEQTTLEYFKIKRPDVECNQPLKYTMIAGRLPTGLQLDERGRVFGTLPIIDDDNMKNFPSYNLYHSNFDYATPIGVRYEFTVKLEIEGGVDDEVFDIREFCIMIVNNWSLTEPYMDAEIYDITGEVDDISRTAEVLMPTTLCPPCNIGNEKEINSGNYVFDNGGNVVIEESELVLPYINSYGSITKGNYISRTPLITDVVQMEYVINAYTNDDVDDVHLPDLLVQEQNEYIILPGDLMGADIYRWVVANADVLVDAGYKKSTLNKYINKELPGQVTYRNGELNLDLIVNDGVPIDPQIAYTQAHENIMKVEPMYIRGTFIPYEMDVEVTYESYR